jgi:hypothetical protein
VENSLSPWVATIASVSIVGAALVVAWSIRRPKALAVLVYGLVAGFLVLAGIPLSDYVHLLGIDQLRSQSEHLSYLLLVGENFGLATAVLLIYRWFPFRQTA